MPGRKSLISFVSQLDLENLSVFSVTDVNKKTPGRSSWGIGVGMLAGETKMILSVRAGNELKYLQMPHCVPSSESFWPLCAWQ